MFQALATLLIASGASAATVTDFRHDVRGDQTCVVDAKPERCLKTLDLGNGIDILTQVTNYGATFDDAGKLRVEHELTKDEFLGAAAGVALSPAHRRALTERFAYLKVNRIAANVDAAPGASEAEKPAELPFLAEVEWAPKADPGRHVMTFVEGRLASDGKEIELDKLDASQLNTLYTGMVHIDRVSTAELGEDVLRDVIAPAVLGNETASVMLQLVEGMAEAIGDILKSLTDALNPNHSGAENTPVAPKI